jgi:hypothetical protein
LRLFLTSQLKSEHVAERDKNRRSIVAVGLLTQRDLDILGSGFRRAIPLTVPGEFDELLSAIDEAERRMGRGIAGHDG